MKTGIYKPFVKDGMLFGKEVNEVPKPETEYDAEGHPHYPLQEYIDEWQQAEQSLQSFKVDEGEYEMVSETRFWTTPSALGNTRNQLCQSGDTFRATLKENTLINLEVL